MLIFKYYGDMSVMRDRFDSIRRYVDYLPTPVTCSNCKAPTNTITHAPNEPELPWYCESIRCLSSISTTCIAFSSDLPHVSLTQT
jgi:hypothetical protein